MAGTIPSEHVEQATFVREFERSWPDVRLFAIPNGGFRHKATAEKLRLEGLKPGVPDIFIPAWRLFIEMKRTKGGRVSSDQAKWIDYLRECGYSVEVAKGWEEAIRICDDIAKRYNGNVDNG